VNWKALQSDVAYLPPGRRRLLIAVAVVLGLGLSLFTAWSVHLWALTASFPQAPFRQPSRLYARPHRLAAGDLMAPSDLAGELAAVGYRAQGAHGTDPAGKIAPTTQTPGALSPGTSLPGTSSSGSSVPGTLLPGTFDLAGDRLAVQLRRFPTPRGIAGGALLEVSFRDGRISRLTLGGREVPETELEPPLLASYYGPSLVECRPVLLAELPPAVIRAVLAAEDHAFFDHAGVSPAATARAVLADLRDPHARQGGSTVTQQLVKNLYLSPRRTLGRKAQEAALAMLLELRQDKRAILEAYLNEIYWGRRGTLHLRGLGAASWAYFGKEPAALTLGEAATLAGMIRSPAEYSPVEHPAAARGRRDWVLRRLAKLRWAGPEDVRGALGEPLATSPAMISGRSGPSGRSARPREASASRPDAPHFADAAALEARGRFGIKDLEDGGYQLFSTLDLTAQRLARAAVEQEVAALEGAERGKRRGGGEKGSHAPLEAALVSVDPRDGAILAYVGGRDYGRSQFDRAGQAHRQLGSAFKPIIYAAAFSAEAATPATLLDDEPIVVGAGPQAWTPQNYDRTFRGWVTARTALEQSLNVPTVRLAFRTGLGRIATLARALGLAGRLDLVPALALGAVEGTPRELAQVYATFAAGGLRPPVHGLAAVVDRFGHPLLTGDPLPRRVLRAQCAYLVNSILQGALDHGTCSGARRLGVTGPLAGKTGTTSERRDNWFAGYSPDRVTVVWVGYDDDSGTHLSGATAAVPVWSRFTRAMRPAAGYADFPRPPGLVQVTLDLETGELATPFCTRRVVELLPEWQVPSPCRLHAPALALNLAPAPDGAGGWWNPVPARDGASTGGIILIRPAARQAAAAAAGPEDVRVPAVPPPG
jgi:penicillin-binding protein 1B